MLLLLKLEGYIDKLEKKIETSSERIKTTQSSIDLVLEDVLNQMNEVQKDVTDRKQNRRRYAKA